MLKRISIGLAAILLVASASVVFWLGSFNSGSYPRPEDPSQTFVFFGLSILIFILMMGLGFMFVRLMIKLWIARQTGGPGSQIRTLLVAGAFGLTVLPVICMCLFSYYVLNNTLKSWFTLPATYIVGDFVKIGDALGTEMSGRALAEAQLIAQSPQAQALLSGTPFPANETASEWLSALCRDNGLLAVRILPVSSMTPLASYGQMPGTTTGTAMAKVQRDSTEIGSVLVAVAVPHDFLAGQRRIVGYISQYDQLSREKSRLRDNFLQVLALVALFILFVATWLAHYLARQLSNPIAELVQGVGEVSRGNLSWRVGAPGIDELAVLTNGFNRMTADLEANRSELEARRRFTEAILESIPTGVISVDSAGVILRVNKALTQMLPGARERVSRLGDLFPAEDATEIRYLMNRARRTGVASRQFEIDAPARTLHLAITVAAIEGGRNAGGRNTGFVIVIEDTSDLLRAQKVAAWSEVARRVAHEIRNPLTPITLSAERIIRQANRTPLPEAVDHLLRECAGTILDEIASVKRLVDEFSQFSRLPAAQLVLCDLNEVISAGIGVFDGRLEAIDLTVDLASGLPPVMADPEQLKRVIVNLVDNAAEAMQDAPVKELVVQTQAGLADTVEIVIADSGCGVTAEEKEKLFVPYFSTKVRGTGLGLAIVSHILAEHGASIRVEDNKPSGARFTIEMPAVPAVEESTEQPAGDQASGPRAGDRTNEAPAVIAQA
ncbi:MAG TPA: ATP-binding protein [Bryobacteraceae bacterium]|nr:ATP-binding protein [Bryobacteraceae bacterium]